MNSICSKLSIHNIQLLKKKAVLSWNIVTRERANDWHPFSYLYWGSCKHKPSKLSLTQLFQLLIERLGAQVMTYETIA